MGDRSRGPGGRGGADRTHGVRQTARRLRLVRCGGIPAARQRPCTRTARKAARPVAGSAVLRSGRAFGACRAGPSSSRQGGRSVCPRVFGSIRNGVSAGGGARARSEHAWYILSLTYPQPHAIFASTNGTMHAHRPAESASAVTLRRFEKVTPTFPEAERRRSLCLFSHPGAAAPFASARAILLPCRSREWSRTDRGCLIPCRRREESQGGPRWLPSGSASERTAAAATFACLRETLRADAAGRVARFLRRLPHSKKIQP